MTEGAPTDEKGYVLPKGSAWAWLPSVGDLESLPELSYPANLSTFDEMQIDPQVSSTLGAVTLPIRSTGWWIDPNGADADVVEFVAQQMGLPVRGADKPMTPARTRDRFSFAEHLNLALDSLPFGHAVFEQVARIEGGRAHLRKLAWRPQRSIDKWDIAEDGGLRSVKQFDSKAAIPIDRLVVYSHGRRGGNWPGRSLLRTSWKFWVLKERMLRVQFMSVDRAGVGMPVYESPPTPDELMASPERAREYAEQQIAAGLAMAREYRSGEDAGAAIPNGAALKVIGVSGTLPDPEKVIRYYDEQIGRSVLANFLSLGGENSRGSYALGSTFADFFVQSLQATATWLCDVLTQHVVEDMIDWNWGTEVRAPRIVCDEIGSKQPLTAEAVAALINSGALQADANLERYLRDAYGVEQRGAEWGKGDLEKLSARVEAFKAMVEAGASFETAKIAAGLASLEEARQLIKDAGADIDPNETPQEGE